MDFNGVIRACYRVFDFIVFPFPVTGRGISFGQYVSIRKTDKLIREQMETLHVNNVDHFAEKLPEESHSLVVMFMKRILAEQKNKNPSSTFVG